MWPLVWTLGVLTLLVLLAKVVEHRLSKDVGGAEDMSRIMRGRLGRTDTSGPSVDGGGATDGGGGGW